MSLQKIYHKLYDEWNIGFMKVEESMLSDESPKVNWMKHKYKDRWFADPQILDIKDGKIKVLVEEFMYSTDIGQIALLTVDSNSYELLDRKEILVLPTHLSFPQVKREGEKVYIFPENGASGKLWLYEYDTEKDELTGNKTLLSDMALADATILPFDEKVMLATSDKPNGNVLDILRWNETTNTYVKDDVFVFDENIARNAGPCFKLGGRWIRPAQVNNNGYGEALELQEVVLKNGKYNFKPLVRWTSPSKRWPLSFHNFCEYKGIAAVDCRGYRYWFSPMLEKVLTMLRK